MDSELINDDLKSYSEEDYSEKIATAILQEENKKNLFFIYPALLTILLLLGLPSALESNPFPDSGFYELNSNTTIAHSIFNTNILSETDLSEGIKDTVYTEKDCWLELRIDQQTLYQHWRNGKTEKYLISSGNKYLAKGIESRPGLFAIFAKEPRHESTQFNNAAMYYFMPFNMGIGFHALDGTGYYGTLGVRPVSHGCIRMRHEDVKKLFNECPMGTIVLAHRGYTARTVAFAPKDFQNPVEFSKDEYKKMMSENLENILEGNYYVKERKFFVMDPKVIPVSGVYISYDRKIPEKQKLNKNTYIYRNNTDYLSMANRNISIKSDDKPAVTNDLTENLFIDEKDIKIETNEVFSDADLIKKYFHNPIGILPYFPPNKD